MTLSNFSENRRTKNGSFASEGHFNRPLSDLSENLDALNADASDVSGRVGESFTSISDVSQRLSDASDRLVGWDRGSVTTKIASDSEITSSDTLSGSRVETENFDLRSGNSFIFDSDASFAGTVRQKVQDRGGQVFNVKAFGAVSEGDIDSNTSAFVEAVSNISQSGGGTLHIPPGRFSVRSVSLPSNVVVEGSGTSGSVLVAEKVQNSSSDSYSNTVLRADGKQNITIRDLTLDGEFDSIGPAANADTEDARMMVDIRNSDRIYIENVDVTGYRTTTIASGTTIEQRRFGPIYAESSKSIYLGNVRVVPFADDEGIRFLDCEQVRVENISYDGGASGVLSTPLHIFGPNTRDVQVSGLLSKGHNGSAANLGGLGPFTVKDCTIDGRGVDFGLEHQHGLWPSQGTLTGVHIHSVDVQDPDSYMVAVGGSETSFAAESISIDDVRGDGGRRGIVVEQVKDVSIRGCSVRNVVATGLDEGRSIQAKSSDDVVIQGNQVIGGSDSGNTTRNNIFTVDCNRVVISDNLLQDANNSNIRVNATEDNTFGDVGIFNNLIRNDSITPLQGIRVDGSVTTASYSGNIIDGEPETPANTAMLASSVVETAKRAPSYDDSSRPDSDHTGAIIFNTDAGTLQFTNGSSWQSVATV